MEKSKAKKHFYNTDFLNILSAKYIHMSILRLSFCHWKKGGGREDEKIQTTKPT